MEPNDPKHYFEKRREFKELEKEISQFNKMNALLLQQVRTGLCDAPETLEELLVQFCSKYGELTVPQMAKIILTQFQSLQKDIKDIEESFLN